MTAALDLYGEHQRTRGTSSASSSTTRRRLDALLERELERPLDELTPAAAARALERYRTTKTRTGEQPAIATLRGTVREASGFGAWCVRRAWLRRNPFAELVVEGASNAGKEQLTRDEARALEALCVMRARDDEAAVAVLCALYFGIRASEIVGLVARDLDDGGELLRVRRAKKRGRAVVDLFPIPAWFRPHLERLAEGGGELFAGRDRTWLYRATRRMCRLAKVPQVGPHQLRGTLGSQAREVVGLTPEQLRRLYGHDDVAITQRHYVDAGAEVRADVAERLRVIQGGRNG